MQSRDVVRVAGFFFGSRWLLVLVAALAIAGGRKSDAQCQVDKLYASEVTPLNGFGQSVAIQGDLAAIVASGEVTLLKQDPLDPTLWLEWRVLDRAGPGPIDLENDTIVTGAPILETARIYERDAGGADQWGEVALLTAPMGNMFDQFASALSLSGDTVLIGAPFFKLPTVNTGAVFVFERDQGGPGAWGFVRKIESATPDSAILFGSAVALSGDTVFVGAPQESDIATNAGAVYILERNAGGPDAWGVVARIDGDAPPINRRLGSSMALDGDRLLVGGAQGKAYLFERNAGGPNNWGQLLALTPFPGLPTWTTPRLHLLDDLLLVGVTTAPFCVTGDAECRSGAVALYQNGEGGLADWPLRSVLTANDADDDDYFGSGIARSGGIVMIGAFGDDDGNPFDPAQRGAVYVFDLDVDCDQCIGDVDGNQVVNVDDIVIVVLAFGSDDANADVNADGIVGIDDIIAVVLAWGPCPTALPVVGAVCHPDANCSLLTEEICVNAGGTYRGDGLFCAPDTCTGGCCLYDGSCPVTSLLECNQMLGGWQGVDGACDPAVCIQHGACCIDGFCFEQFDDASCATNGGEFHGVSSTCTPSPCTPAGACCLPNGSCQDVPHPGICPVLGGVYQGDETLCARTNCPPPAP